MKKPLALTLSLSLVLQTITLPWTLSAAPGAPSGPGAPTPPPIVITPSYEIEGSFTGRVVQTQQIARAAQNASITLLIGGIQDNFPALNGFSTDCFNQDGPGPAYAYAIFLDNSSINMSQCEAYNGTEIIRNAGPMIIDPFTAPTTKATPTQVASAMVTRGYLNHAGTNNPAFTITRTNGRYVTFTRTDNSEGNINYIDSNGTSYSRFFPWSSVPAQTALSSQVQQSEYVPSNPRYNERFNMVVDYNTYEYIVQEDDSVLDVVAGLVTAYNNNTISGITCTDDVTRVLCSANTDDRTFNTNAYIIYEIEDGIAPQITINEQNFVGTQTGSQYVEAGSIFTESATWIDNRAGTGTVTGTGDIVDTSMTGSYMRTYSVSDPTGNETTVTMTYIVQDTTAPDILLNGQDTLTVELDNGYVDEGAVWSDNLDGSDTITGTIIDDERTALGTGTYALSYDVTDRSGNNAGVSRSITVVDTIAPRLGKVRFPDGAIDADYFYTDWSISGADTVTISGGLLTGSTSVKRVSRNLYRIFVPLVQNSTNYFDLVATDISGNQRSFDFSIVEASAGIKNTLQLTATGGTAVTDVSEVTGTQTGATKVVPKVDLTIQEGGESERRVFIPQDTEITRKDGGTFDPTQIKAQLATVTGGLTGTDRSRGAIEFGKSGTPLQFSKPVRVQFSLSGTSYTGTTIEVKVKHAGESTFTTAGLTNNSGATCSGGLASAGTNIGTVTENIVTIYTCAASTFTAVTPDGPQNPTPVVISVSSGGGGGGGGGGSSSYSSVISATSTGSSPISTGSTVPTLTGSIILDASKNTARSYTITPIASRLKSNNGFRTEIEGNFEKLTTISLPTNFSNGTKVIVYRIEGKKKIRITIVKVKSGMITFRTKKSGTYEFIKTR